MDLLINLDSPVIKNKPNSDYNSRNPLIPCPDIPGNYEQNNPFDAVVNAVEFSQQPDDPFDIALNAALKNSESNKQDDLGDEKLKSEPKSDNSEIKKCEDIKECSIESSLNDLSTADIIKIKSNVKEFVKERIISCIKKTINKTQNNIPDATQNNYRRSFSAGIIRSVGFTPLEEIQSSNYCSTLNSSLPSVGSCYPETASSMCNDSIERQFNNTNSIISDCNDLESTKKMLRGDADRLRVLLNQEPLFNKSDDKSNDSSQEDNIFAELPPPGYFESDLIDEKDSIGLPKLKLFRHSFSGIPNQKSFVEENVIDKYMKFKNKNDLNQTNENQVNKEDSVIECFTPDKVAASSSMLEDLEKTSDIPVTKEPVNMKNQIKKNLVNNITPKSLRLKKKTGNEFLKKGPMRAVVPLQKMSKNISAKISSPFKTKSHRSSKTIKIELNQEKKIEPIAASTPTQSPVSSATNARLRGRENNKISPTARNMVKRSSSVGVVDSRRSGIESPPSTPSKLLNSSSSLKLKPKLGVTPPKVPVRPKSAPSGNTSDQQSQLNFKRAALKALASSPFNKANGKTSAKKASPKTAGTVTLQNKENRRSLTK